MKANVHKHTARLMSDIKDEFSIGHFIETGTNVGETAEWGSEQFDQVTTIEMADDLHAKAVDERGYIENIRFVKGKSQERLQEIAPDLKSSCVFHLDAHCGGKWRNSSGDMSVKSEMVECPVLEELDAIGQSEHDHFLFIDDARVFTSPRREPFNMDEWPSIQEIISKAEELNEDNHVIIYNDQIIVAPPFGTDFIRERVRAYKTETREQSSHYKRRIMNKVWMHASLSGPVRDL